MTTANLALADNDTVIQYTAAGGETEFEFDFPILDEAELAVSVDQADQVLGTDYTVAGVGAESGGTITFTTARTAGELITIWLAMDIKRLTGFSTGAAVLAGSALNTELARQVRHDQMLRRDIARCLRLPVDDVVTGQNMELATADTRKGKFMRFSSSDGSLELAEELGAGQTLSQSIIAGHLHPETADETAAGATPTNLVYLPGDVRRYGAVGDGVTDDREALETAFSIGIPVFIPAGRWLINTAATSQWAIERSADKDFRVVSEGTIVAGANLETAITTNGAVIRVQTATNPADPLPSFSWRGGRWDLSALDTDTSGLDGLSIGPKFGSVLVDDIEFDHGIVAAVDVDVGVGGGDSSIFCKEPELFVARGIRCFGAPDVGLYVSGDPSSSRTGRNAVFMGCKFERCLNGVAMKRDFEFTHISGCTFLECVNGILWGVAEGSQTNQGKRGLVVGNVFRRCQGGPLNLSNNKGIAIIGNEMIDYRRWVSDGTTATVVASGNVGGGARLSGCSGCSVVGNVIGFEDWTAPNASEGGSGSGAAAVTLIGDTDPTPAVNCDNNVVVGNVLKNCHSGILTGALANNNILAPNQSFGHTTADTISGSGNQLLPTVGGDGSGLQWTASGFLRMLVGGGEALRCNGAAGDVNFVATASAATGSNPSVRARGDDVDIDLILSGRGSGLLSFGAFTVNADAPVTGYIQVKDEGGTVRKLAVIA